MKCGFVINEEKSLWEPIQTISWLGIVLNSRCNRVSVTEKRISKLKKGIEFLKQCEDSSVKAKELEAVIGQIISLSPCVGNLTRIMTRSIYAVLNQKKSWYANVPLSEEAREEIEFWESNDDCVNGCRSCLESEQQAH